MKSLLVICVFSILDAVCYVQSKFPERALHWWSMLPGSGFITLVIHGRVR